MHFTYVSPDLSTLKQGDILHKTEGISNILQEVHPHYLKSDYLSFIILTQSCDLVRRGSNKKCKAKYITLAAVRPFRLLIERVIGDYKKINKWPPLNILDDSDRTKFYNFVERLFNNNDPEYFYLNDDASLGFSESCVAFLRLSIAIKSDIHYDSCVEAKILELNDTFKAKLGWLVGNMYSRVGTEDWVPYNLNQGDFVKKINNVLDEYCIWLDIKKFKRELLKSYDLQEIEKFDEAKIKELLSTVKIASMKKSLLNRLEVLLLEKGVVSPDSVKKVIAKIDSDYEITSILS
jgi:hypothetical protein